MTIGPETGIKPLLPPPKLLVALALGGGTLEPVAFMAVFATTLVLLVAVKLWTAQRLLGAGMP